MVFGGVPLYLTILGLAGRALRAHRRAVVVIRRSGTASTGSTVPSRYSRGSGAAGARAGELRPPEPRGRGPRADRQGLVRHPGQDALGLGAEARMAARSMTAPPTACGRDNMSIVVGPRPAGPAPALWWVDDGRHDTPGVLRSRWAASSASRPQVCRGGHHRLLRPARCGVDGAGLAPPRATMVGGPPCQRVTLLAGSLRAEVFMRVLTVTGCGDAIAAPMSGDPGRGHVPY